MGPASPAPTNPYPDYFKEVHEAQEARKQSLEARAAAVIAVSGTVVTVLVTIAGLATKSSPTFSLSEDARWYLYAALVMLVSSTIIAILPAVPLLYREVTPGGLIWIATSAWNEPAASAELRIGVTRARNLAWNKRVNDIKAVILVVALGAQIAAIIFLAYAAWEILSVADLVPAG